MKPLAYGAFAGYLGVGWGSELCIWREKSAWCVSVLAGASSIDRVFEVGSNTGGPGALTAMGYPQGKGAGVTQRTHKN